jgi:hypothetical protein
MTFKTMGAERLAVRTLQRVWEVPPADTRDWPRFEAFANFRLFLDMVVLRNIFAREERNILQTIKRGNANYIGHIFRTNCLLKRVTKGKIGGTWK